MMINRFYIGPMKNKSDWSLKYSDECRLQQKEKLIDLYDEQESKC